MSSLSITDRMIAFLQLIGIPIGDQQDGNQAAPPPPPVAPPPAYKPPVDKIQAMTLLTELRDLTVQADADQLTLGGALATRRAVVVQAVKDDDYATGRQALDALREDLEKEKQEKETQQAPPSPPPQPNVPPLQAHAAALDVESVPPPSAADVPPLHASAQDIDTAGAPPPSPQTDGPPPPSVSEVLDWISNVMRMSKEEVFYDPACHPKLAAALAQDFYLGDEQASGLIRDAVKVMEPNYNPSPPSLNEVFDWIYITRPFHVCVFGVNPFTSNIVT